MANYFERLADVRLFVDMRSYGQMSMCLSPSSNSTARMLGVLADDIYLIVCWLWWHR